MRTANIRPLEMARAKWGTSENIKKHYDVLARVLLTAGVAVENPAYDPDVPNMERLFITKPGRISSRDERGDFPSNDGKDKNKSKDNRSIVVKGGSTDALAKDGIVQNMSS